jgi:hypothetical protein
MATTSIDTLYLCMTQIRLCTCSLRVEYKKCSVSSPSIITEYSQFVHTEVSPIFNEKNEERRAEGGGGGWWWWRCVVLVIF